MTILEFLGTWFVLLVLALIVSFILFSVNPRDEDGE